MPHLATDRISRGLRWAGTALLLAGVMLIVAGIGWTQSADALIMASAVAVLAFGLPGAAAFGLAFWLQHTADRLEQVAPTNAATLADAASSAGRNPFREPLRRYAVAIVTVAVAWTARVGLDAFLPHEVPFITYFLAVAVAGWLGGFGPAALATLLSLVLTWYAYVMPEMGASPPALHRFVALGLFVFVCLGLATITAALHAALDRTQHLAALTRRQNDLLAASENRFRALVAHFPVMVWMTDAQRTCTFFNPAWLRFRGRTPEQELGHGWEEGVHPDDLVRRRAVSDDAHENRAAFAVKYRLRRADGEYQWLLDQAAPRFNDDGSFAGYVGVSTPIDPPADASSVNA